MGVGHTSFVTRGGAELSFTRLGFGTAPLGNFQRALSEDEAEAVVGAAWDAGMRFFDTAPLYGHGLSELRLGRVLRDKPRGNYLISTKVGRCLVSCEKGEGIRSGSTRRQRGACEGGFRGPYWPSLRRPQGSGQSSRCPRRPIVKCKVPQIT